MSGFLSLLLFSGLLEVIGFDKFPLIIRGPDIKRVGVGDSLTYHCEAFGDPSPTLNWDFNGKPSRSSKWIHITYVNTYSTLHFKKILVSMEGEYCCNANNGHYTASHCGQLKVKRVPTITRNPSNRSVLFGGTTSFPCEVNAYPKPKISWLHNNEQIFCLKQPFEDCGSYYLTHSNSLRIVDASLTDEGLYRCLAMNDVGRTFSSPAYLTVIERKTTLADKVTEPVTTTDSRHTKTTAQRPETSTAGSSIFTETASVSAGVKSTIVTQAMSVPRTQTHGSNKTVLVTESRILLEDMYHSANWQAGHNTVTVIIFLGCCLLITFGLFVLCVVRKKRGRERRSEDAMKAFHLCEENHLKKVHNRGAMQVDLDRLRYPVEKLEIIDELGEGVFGLVFKARAPDILPSEKVTTVAVKTIRARERHNLPKVEDFNREAELLSTFRHSNIVQLLGVCLNGENASGRKNISCLLFEYVDGGDLCAYLRNHGPNRALFRTSDSGTQEYKEIYDSDRLMISTDIACGMQYLSDRNFIHRDLATRNCLISLLTHRVKIADFGLSRRTYESDYYQASDAESVPIRWMSPESILYGKYSSQSDVWAFGVTLWEVYTYALQPYFSLTNEEVICCVCQGSVLSAPSAASTWMYNLMQLCWHRSPEERPSFATIYSVLEAIRQNEGKLPLCEILPSEHTELVNQQQSTYPINPNTFTPKTVPPVCDGTTNPLTPPPKGFLDEGCTTVNQEDESRTEDYTSLSVVSHSSASTRSGRESVV